MAMTVLAFALMPACARGPAPEQSADTIYTGGDIVTVNDAQPTAEAVAVKATVNRVSRSGKVMGPEERLTPIEALKAITLWGAYEHFEEGTKGSIEVGKLADLVVLSANPLTVDPMTINQIVVLETIKEGKSVYKRSP